MKRIALAGIVALALTFAWQQKAAAGGFTISIGGNCYCNSSCNNGNCCFPGCYYCGYGYKWAHIGSVPITWPTATNYYAPDCGYGMGYAAPAQYPAMAAQPAYSYPNYAAGYYGGNAYAYNQSPSYWYGR